MNHPHEWDDRGYQQMYDRYGVDQTYGNPYADRLDPTSFGNADDYYHTRVVQSRLFHVIASDMMTGSYGMPSSTRAGSIDQWSAPELTPQEANKQKARKSMYQQALNLAAYLEMRAMEPERDRWASPDRWWVTLRRLELAIEAYEDGDEDEATLKERLNRYLNRHYLSRQVLEAPPVPKLEQHSVPPPQEDEDEPEGPEPQGRWARFMHWLYE
ncbi:MAG TPA: hypothetical protein VJ843_05905 [Candidatus Saccharimonadales bacterium]|nr:hypothetical protein [Candidatus Saccharimonadales bacterium]